MFMSLPHSDVMKNVGGGRSSSSRKKEGARGRATAERGREAGRGENLRSVSLITVFITVNTYTRGSHYSRVNLMRFTLSHYSRVNLMRCVVLRFFVVQEKERLRLHKEGQDQPDGVLVITKKNGENDGAEGGEEQKKKRARKDVENDDAERGEEQNAFYPFEVTLSAYIQVAALAAWRTRKQARCP
jgi:hypothetical protein